jgi:hypothetical protein
VSDPFDVGDILARNPHIDPDRVTRVTTLIERLRALGVGRKEYDLALPYGGRRVTPPDQARSEPRLRQARERLTK